MIKADLEKAIRETLVIDNKESIDLCISKIIKIIDGYFPDYHKFVIDSNYQPKVDI